MNKDPINYKELAINISVIIPTLNRNQPLVDMLRNLLKYQQLSSFEIVVVDQSDSHDKQTTDYLNQIASSIRLVKPPFKNLCKARNLGVSTASSEVVLFFDDDIQLLPGTIEAHRKAHEDQAFAAVTGPLISRAPEFRLRERGELSAGELKEISDRTQSYFGVNFAYSSSKVNGCNMSFKKSYLQKIGGFDENFYGSSDGEDFELSYRLRKAGGNIWYDPQAAVVYTKYATGGCRDLGGCRFVESKSFNNQYFLLRTEAKPDQRSALMLSVYRGHVLNKKTFFSGRFIPYAFSFLKGIVRARAAHHKKYREPV